MFTVTGACPRCGAPIYVPTVWHSIMPPAPVKTCLCFPEPRSYTTTSTHFLDLPASGIAETVRRS